MSYYTPKTFNILCEWIDAQTCDNEHDMSSKEGLIKQFESDNSYVGKTDIRAIYFLDSSDSQTEIRKLYFDKNGNAVNISHMEAFMLTDDYEKSILSKRNNEDEKMLVKENN